MTTLIDTSASVVNVFSRSTLTVIDRYIYGLKGKNLFIFLSINTFLPFLIGLTAVLAFKDFAHLWKYIFSTECMIFSPAIQLVSFSYCLAFKKWEVRHVELQGKISDLFLPLVFFIIPASFLHGMEATQWQLYIPMVLSWIGFTPLIIKHHLLRNIINKSTLLICSSLIIEESISMVITKTSFSNGWDAFVFALGTLFWRSIISIICSIISHFSLPKTHLENSFKEIESLDFKLTMVIFVRALITLVTQVTFIFTIATTHPLIIWPILNSTPLVSSICSKIVLKEKLFWPEMFALVCLMMASTSPMIINIKN